MVADATLNNIRGQVDWLHKVADAYKGDATLIFYYAGHGVPDVKSKEAYLLPVDGYASSLITVYTTLRPWQNARAVLPWSSSMLVSPVASAVATR